MEYLGNRLSLVREEIYKVLISNVQDVGTPLYCTWMIDKLGINFALSIVQLTTCYNSIQVVTCLKVVKFFNTYYSLK